MRNEQYLVLAALGLSLAFALFGNFGLGLMASFLLAVIGLVIGFTTITKREVQEFLIVSLVIGGGSAALWAVMPAGTEWLSTMGKAFFANLSIAILPAAFVVGAFRWYDLSGKK
jgi:hypothetical protein